MNEREHKIGHLGPLLWGLFLTSPLWARVAYEWFVGISR